MAEVTFSKLLARADEETLAELIGPSVVRLLNRLDDNLTRPGLLRDLVCELYSPAGMLRDHQQRVTLVKLLRRGEAALLADRTAQGDGDPFISLMRWIPRKNSRAEIALLDFFGISAPPSVKAEALTASVEIPPAYALFSHQRAAVAELNGHLTSPPYRAVLHMPTGSGKTRTAMSLIVDELRRNEPSVVTWLAYSEELCEQTASEFEKAWGTLGNRTVEVHRFWGSSDGEPSNLKDGLLVAGLGKMYGSVKRRYASWATLADRTSLVVIDEAHQAVAETYKAVLELLVERHEKTQLLGLTATPGRTWADVEEDEKLANFFGRKKVTLHVEGHKNPVLYLVAEGYLAETSFKSLHYGGPELTPKEVKELSESLDIPKALLDRLASDEQRNLLIVAHLESLAREHQRLIVFGATVKHAELLAVVLRARGLDASSVTAHTPRPERERLVRRFRSDADGVQILCNYGVLTTGFDAPRTSAALIARPTRSLVLYSQMVGRAIRGPRVGGNKYAEVLTVVDTNLPGFGDVASAFFNWEDVWDE